MRRLEEHLYQACHHLSAALLNVTCEVGARYPGGPHKEADNLKSVASALAEVKAVLAWAGGVLNSERQRATTLDAPHRRLKIDPKTGYALLGQSGD